MALLPYLVVQYNYVPKNSDDYWKATYRAESLIIGGSRALRGVSPDVMKEKLALEGRVLNFAFNGKDTPYGEQYYKLILRKLKKDSHSGIFILSVTPGLIMDVTRGNPLRESDFGFDDLYFVNMNPNVEFLLRMPTANFSLLHQLVKKKNKNKERATVYPNGWVAFDQSAQALLKWKDEYVVPNQLQENFIVSETREYYLDKTIKTLQAYGDVYLVRLPVGPAAYAREGDMYPDFDNKMQQLAKRNNSHYLDFSNWTSSALEPIFFDKGKHHLRKDAAVKFTEDLCDTITTLRTQNK